MLTPPLWAQNSDFCDAVQIIMRDAPNQFRDICGKEVSNSMFAIVWESGIKLPGTIAARFVYAKGLFYEDALLQTRNKQDIMPVYNMYTNMLDSCLMPLGYVPVDIENANPGLEGYKKIAWFDEQVQDTSSKTIPPHVALEVTQTNEKDLFTLVLFIYEH